MGAGEGDRGDAAGAGRSGGDGQYGPGPDGWYDGLEGSGGGPGAGNDEGTFHWGGGWGLVADGAEDC